LGERRCKRYLAIAVTMFRDARIDITGLSAAPACAMYALAAHR
jgi:hypothetical protein